MDRRAWSAIIAQPGALKSASDGCVNLYFAFLLLFTIFYALSSLIRLLREPETKIEALFPTGAGEQGIGERRTSNKSTSSRNYAACGIKPERAG